MLVLIENQLPADYKTVQAWCGIMEINNKKKTIAGNVQVCTTVDNCRAAGKLPGPSGSSILLALGRGDGVFHL